MTASCLCHGYIYDAFQMMALDGLDPAPGVRLYLCYGL